MKRLFALSLMLFLLVGCKEASSNMDQALAMRQQLLKNSCTFCASITADYEDIIYSFKLNCKADPAGDIQFAVVMPEEISGITGIVGAKGGKLTFDDKELAFPLLADGLISPVSAPWLFIRSARSGYIKSSGTADNETRITINDNYASEALQVDIYLDQSGIPTHADLYWQGRRILSMDITDFVYV